MTVLDLPFVSVIVPAWNASRTVTACIESVLLSDYPRSRYEVIAVDNDSTDETLTLLGAFGDRVRVVRESTRGPGATRNAGVAVARGSLIAFTDADCEVESTWLRQITGPLARGDADVTGGRILAFPEANAIAHFGERIHDHKTAIEYFRPAYVITMNMGVVTTAFQNVGGFDARLLRGEDVDITYRLHEAGARLQYVDGAVTFHHNRDTLTALAREAWKHGYHAPKVRRLHREMIARVEREQEGRPHLGPPVSSFSRTIGRGREKLLWAWFRGFKRLGKTVGSLRAEDLLDV